MIVLRMVIPKGRSFLRLFFFLDIGSPHRHGLIGFVRQCFDNTIYFGFTETVRRILVYSFCCRTVVGIQVFVCHKVNVRTQQIAIQFL